MLTEVTRRVIDHQNREFDPARDRVQVPAPTHTLTKLLYLWVDCVSVQKEWCHGGHIDLRVSQITAQEANASSNLLVIYYDFIGKQGSEAGVVDTNHAFHL